MTNSTPISRTHRGFTLLELLVVMTIIGVLAGMVFAVGPGILKSMQKLKVKGDMQALELAILDYYTEYGRYPVDREVLELAIREAPKEVEGISMNDNMHGIDVVVGGAEGRGSIDELMNVLLAEPKGWNKDHLMNPKRIAFLAPSPAKPGPTGPRNGLASDGKLYDRWGNEYRIFMDTSYDEKLSGPSAPNFDYTDYPIKGSDGAFNLRLMILSVGEDGEVGSKKKALKNPGVPGREYDGSDDVASWL